MENNNTPERLNENPIWRINLINIGIQFGLIFAVPLMALMGIGIYLDRTYATTPLFILIGFFLAVTISSVVIYKRLRKIFQSLNLINK